MNRPPNPNRKSYALGENRFGSQIIFIRNGEQFALRSIPNSRSLIGEIREISLTPEQLRDIAHIAAGA